MPTEKVHIPSHGKKLAAVIHYPKEQTDRLAILCPGFLDTKDYPHLVKLADALTAQGYTAIRFDPVGTWESDGDISDYTTTQYLANVKNILAYMRNRENYTHVLLGGHSRGGFVAIFYAAQDPKVSAVLGIMPPYNLLRTKREERDRKWKEDGFNISKRDVPGGGEKEFRVPYSNMEDAKQYDVLSEVSKLRVPLILVAGEKDNLIPPEEVQKIFDNANEPKKMIVMKGIGHDYRRNPEEIETVNSEIIESLDELFP